MQTDAADLESSRWYLGIKPFKHFSQITDPLVYVPAPDDSLLALTDVIASTGAIAEGNYKAVNMAGAAAISAVRNALGQSAFPFVFGGDGASFLVARSQEERTRAALAATARWTQEQLGLTLRTALVPVSEIRRAGRHLTVARFEAAAHVSYAMFSGGGLDWAEQQMKSGHYLVAPAPPGVKPDLEGLSCRWSVVDSQHGTIMSLIVREAPGAAVGAYAACVAEIIALIEQGDQGAGHPISANQLQFRWPPAGLDLEARAGSGSLWSRKLALWGYTLVGYIAFRSGWHIGGFDPTRYRQNIAINSDYRKFDDGLRMTVDCRLETADEIERILSQAKLAHIVNYGCHRQNAAQITCIVPSIHADDHMHFIDGSNGGYAIAAQKITRSPTARDY